MRCLHLIRSLDPAGGGPAESVRQTTRELRARGHEVRIATLDQQRAPWLRGAAGEGVIALGLRSAGYGYSSRYVPWLRANAMRFDRILVHGLWQYTSFGAWRALRRSPNGYCVFPHGMLDPWFKRTYPVKHLKKCLYWPWAEYLVLRDAQAVLFTCAEEMRLASQSFWPYRVRGRVIPYGTAPPPEEPQRQRAAFLESFPQLRGRRYLLFLGRIHEKKGVDLLLRAFAALRPRDWELVIAGPGADSVYGRSMQQLSAALEVHDRVTWTGHLGGDVKWGAFRGAEAFVLPSHQENFGIAVVEALACGLPVLISKQVNIWREIVEGGAGWAEENTLDGTVRLLEWARHQVPPERARSVFDQRFSIGRTVEAFTEL